MFSASKITFFSPHHKTFPRVFALIYTKQENSSVPPPREPVWFGPSSAIAPKTPKAGLHPGKPALRLYLYQSVFKPLTPNNHEVGMLRLFFTKLRLMYLFHSISGLAL